MRNQARWRRYARLCPTCVGELKNRTTGSVSGHLDIEQKQVLQAELFVGGRLGLLGVVVGRGTKDAREMLVGLVCVSWRVGANEKAEWASRRWLGGGSEAGRVRHCCQSELADW